MAGMGIIVLSLPFLNLGMSMGGIFLACTWVVHSIYLGIKNSDPFFNLKKVKLNTIALMVIGFFLLHVLGLIHTEDLNYGFKDLRIKLPLLFLPLVFTGVPAFTKKDKAIVEYLFVGACAIAAAIIIVNFSLHHRSSGNVRGAHKFISHIRFGLMAAFAIYIIYRHLFFDKKKLKLLLLLPLIILLFYLVKLQSITGVISLIIAFTVTGWIEMSRIKSLKWKWILSLVLLGVMLGSASYVYFKADQYFDIPLPSETELNSLTVEGNSYEHKLGDNQVENGNLIWYFISWGELADAWRKRSEIPFEGKDQRNQPVASTLIRYLSSKGLRKDREGMNALTDEDIAWIERGVPNLTLRLESGVNRRLQILFFEINGYLNGANPSGNSLTQRFEFWRAGKHILDSRWLIGVGTGDPPRAFKRAYFELDSPLDEEFRHRAHNQYMSSWIALGVFGLLWVLSLLILPFLISPRSRSLKYIAFLLIVSLSFLTEDTLETQVGITFFSFFYCYFLILPVQKNAESKLE